MELSTAEYATESELPNSNQIDLHPCNIQSPAGSPSKGPGYFKKRKREAEESQSVGESEPVICSFLLP
jgi:hypothetical protein